MSVDLYKFFLILTASLLLSIVAWSTTKGWAQRLMIFGILIGLFLYSGIGISNKDSSYVYITNYLAIFLSIIIGFNIGNASFRRLGINISSKAPPLLDLMEKKGSFKKFILFYIAISMYPLIWPEFRLQLLINPPQPNLKDTFINSFNNESADAITSAFNYIKILITPFFYISLYAFRRKIKLVALILFFLLYIEYASKSTIGRGALMMNIGYIILSIWIFRPNSRRILTLSIISSMPALLVAFYWYSIVRIGGEIYDINIESSISTLIEQEFSFFNVVGEKIIESGARTSLLNFFIWMATLPIPKFLIGQVEGGRINYEISEIILGIKPGENDWYVVLPGLVAESIYIYGDWFYWIHGLMIGFIAAFFCRISERVPHFIFMHFYVVLLFSYALNRAGINSLLPVVVNGFLLFYFLIYIFVLNKSSYTNPYKNHFSK